MTARVALKKVDGVEEAEASYEAGSATVTFDPNVTSPTEFLRELTRLTGFTAVLVETRKRNMQMPHVDSTPPAEHSH